MENKKSKTDIIRNIIGAIFIFSGVVEIFGVDILAGIFLTLFGVSLLPKSYQKTNLKKYKYIQIILPIILIIIFGMVSPKKTIETNNSVTEEIKEIEATNVKINAANIEMDIKETKNIEVYITPKESNIENIEICISNNEILAIEKNNIEKEGKITLKIKPLIEGECNFYVKTENGIESNKIYLKIIDNERIQKEKTEAEEKIQKEAEQKKAEEEKAKQEESKKQVQSTKTQSSSKSTTSKTDSQKSTKSSNKDVSGTVYATPTGKRYHYSSSCGGENSYSTSLNSAVASGLTPCKKCAQ